MSAVQPLRGEGPTAPGGLPAATQTAQAVTTSVVAGGAGEVGTGLAPPADVPLASALFGGHLLPAVLLVLLWSVAVGAVCWGYGFGYGWDRAYPLGVEEGARAVTIEAYQQGREAGYSKGRKAAQWDCWADSWRAL